MEKMDGIIWSMLLSYKEYKDYEKEVEKYKNKYGNFISKYGINVSKLDNDPYVHIREDNLFYYNFRERNDAYKSYSLLRKRLLKLSNLEIMVYYVENEMKVLKKSKEFKLIKRILDEDYPRKSYFRNSKFSNDYATLLGKLGNSYNPEREKARRNFRVMLKDKLGKEIIIFYRKNFNKNLQKELNEVAYRYEFYTKTVIDEKEFSEINSFFGKKSCINLKEFILY